MYFFKRISFVLLLITLFLSCKKSPTFPGKYEDEVITSSYTYYKIELISIELLSFSFSTSAYSANDGGSGPDIFFRYYTDNSMGKYTNNQIYNNMTPANLPYKFIFTQPLILISSKLAMPTSEKQTLSDLNIISSTGPNNRIGMLDYDGPPTFSPLTAYNQTLTSFNIGYCIFKEGTNTVISENGDAIIEYKITKL